MKYLAVLSVVFCAIVLSSCDTRDQIKVAMDKSFKEYITNNDAKKNYKTKIQFIETLSYEKLDATNRENTSEVYEAKVYFVGTTSYIGSMKIYNINDTVTSYFDKDLKMTRMINSNFN